KNRKNALDMLESAEGEVRNEMNATLQRIEAKLADANNKLSEYRKSKRRQESVRAGGGAQLRPEETLRIGLTPAPAATKPQDHIPTDADCFDDYLAGLEARRSDTQSRGLVGLATGLARLDQATGGVQQITVIGGRTQTGKTSLATQICLAALRNDP